MRVALSEKSPAPAEMPYTETMMLFAKKMTAIVAGLLTVAESVLPFARLLFMVAQLI